MDEHKSDKHGKRTIRSLGENQVVIKESNCTVGRLGNNWENSEGKGKDVEINITMVVTRRRCHAPSFFVKLKIEWTNA